MFALLYLFIVCSLVASVGILYAAYEAININRNIKKRIVEDEQRQMDTGGNKKAGCATQGTRCSGGQEDTGGQAERSRKSGGEGSQTCASRGNTEEVSQKMKIKTFEQELPKEGQMINLYLYNFSSNEWAVWAGMFNSAKHVETRTDYLDKTTVWTPIVFPDWIPPAPPTKEAYPDEVKQEEVQPETQVQAVPAI
jgi:hypothetical protein